MAPDIPPGELPCDSAFWATWAGCVATLLMGALAAGLGALATDRGFDCSPAQQGPLQSF